MKKGKIILSTVALGSMLATVFAFTTSKKAFTGGNVYTTNTTGSFYNETSCWFPGNDVNSCTPVLNTGTKFVYKNASGYHTVSSSAAFYTAN